MNDEEKIFENIARENRAEEIFKSEDCEIWKMKNSSGDGLITMYNVFPGVIVMYQLPDMAGAMATPVGLLAHCDEFAEKMADGYNTMIGENGSELSGGERQRISIARAFLKDAPIILLDEATASLDVDNETLIQQSLSELIKNKTVLIIAHRMRTVASADKIVVLKDGVVAEQGSPAELEAKNGIYKHMMSMQLKSAEWKMN